MPKRRIDLTQPTFQESPIAGGLGNLFASLINREVTLAGARQRQQQLDADNARKDRAQELQERDSDRKDRALELQERRLSLGMGVSRGTSAKDPLEDALRRTGNRLGISRDELIQGRFDREGARGLAISRNQLGDHERDMAIIDAESRPLSGAGLKRAADQGISLREVGAGREPMTPGAAAPPSAPSLVPPEVQQQTRRQIEQDAFRIAQGLRSGPAVPQTFTRQDVQQIREGTSGIQGQMAAIAAQRQQQESNEQVQQGLTQLLGADRATRIGSGRAEPEDEIMAGIAVAATGERGMIEDSRRLFDPGVGRPDPDFPDQPIQTIGRDVIARDVTFPNGHVARSADNVRVRDVVSQVQGDINLLLAGKHQNPQALARFLIDEMGMPRNKVMELFLKARDANRELAGAGNP